MHEVKVLSQTSFNLSQILYLHRGWVLVVLISPMSLLNAKMDAYETRYIWPSYHIFTLGNSENVNLIKWKDYSESYVFKILDKFLFKKNLY